MGWEKDGKGVEKGWERGGREGKNRWKRGGRVGGKRLIGLRGAKNSRGSGRGDAVKSFWAKVANRAGGWDNQGKKGKC